MTPPPRRDAREHLALPMTLTGLLLGFALLAVLVLDAPRVALAVVICALVIILAILRELILSGDR